ncbi:MAG: DUF2292 domain-containing protein [Candidatus Pacebacteria bacterium]|nr:DUF2292 domain-containing protein [Candidatus Paceibacterota bacterium]
MTSSLYSTQSVSKELLAEIKKTLEGLDFGSLEVYVVNNQVTQITKRQIKKTGQK